MNNGNVLWNKRVEPYCRAAKQRGFQAEVMRHALKIAPDCNWSRAHISGWLATLPAMRKEPSAGNGEILLEACRRAVADRKAGVTGKKK